MLWSKDPAFQLTPLQSEENPLGACRNCISLYDLHTERKKILVPIKPIAKEKAFISTGRLDIKDEYRIAEYLSKKCGVDLAGQELSSPQVGEYSFVEYDVDGNETTPLNLEGRLHLSYLLLAQKKSREALDLLQSCPKEITVTPCIENMLLQICKLPLGSASSTASSVAVAMRAGLFLIRHHQKTKPEEPIPKELQESLESLYGIYANSINNVEGGLLLSEEERGELKPFAHVDIKNLSDQRAGEMVNGEWDSLQEKNGIASLKRIEAECSSLLNEIKPTSGFNAEKKYADFYAKIRSSSSVEDRLYYSSKFAALDLTDDEGTKTTRSALLIALYWNELSHLFPGVTLPASLDPPQVLLSPPFNSTSHCTIQTYLSKKDRVDVLNTDKGKGASKGRVTLASLEKVLKTVTTGEKRIDYPLESHLTDKIEMTSLSPSMYFSAVSKLRREGISLAFSSDKEVSLDERAVKEEKERIQQSFQLGKLANEQEKTYFLKEGVSVDFLKKALLQKRSALTRDLEVQKEEILQLVNKRPINPEQANLSAQLVGSEYIAEVEFEKLVTAFLSGSRDDYLHLNVHLSSSETDRIDLKLREFLIKSNDVMQMQRALSKNTIDLMGKELSAGPEYKSSDSNLRLFLVFEYRADVRMRPKQVKLINVMIEENPETGTYKDSVAQLMMGGGKTSVLTSILLQKAARPGRIAFFVPPSSQFETLSADLASRQKKNFYRDIIAINYRRSDFTPTRLEWLKKQFIHAKTNGEAILTTPETLQSLHLELESLLCKPRDKRSNEEEEKLGLLAFLVSEMKNVGDILLDEIDLTLSSKNEMIFTQGKKEPILEEELDLVQEVVSLHVDPVDVLQIKENKQGSFGLKRYKEEVLPEIANRLMLKYPDLVPYKDYILGKAKEIPEGFEESPRVETLRKIFQFIPTTLQKSAKQKYDRAPSGSKEAVIPYASAGNATTREFGTTIECSLYHYQTVLFAGVTEDQLQLLASKMAQKATYYAYSRNVPFHDTEEAKKFKLLTNVDLAEFAYHQTEAVFKSTLAYLNQSEERKLNVERQTIKSVVGSYPGYFESDAQVFCSQFASVRGFSGTPWNQCGYQKSLQNDSLLDPETEGQIIDKCLQKETENSIKIVQKLGVFPLLESISPDATGFIDGAGMFKETDNKEVALQIMTYHKENPKMQSVLFFGKDGSLCALKKREGAEPEFLRIGSTQRKEIEKYDIQLTSTFVYYDECHSEATDIVQIDSALNAVSIDHKTSLRTMLQSILRLRGFFNEQNVQYVMAKEERAHFPEKLNVSTLIESGVKNQAKLKAQEFNKSCKQKIDVIFKQALFPLGVKMGSLSEFKEFFFHLSNKNYPSNFQKYAQEKESQFQTLIKDKGLCAKVKKQLEVLMKEIENSSYSGLSVSEEGLELEVENEALREQELALELQKEVQQELQGYQERRSLEPAKEVNWSKFSEDLFAVQSLTETRDRPLIYLAKEMVPDKYKSLLSDDLCISTNFAHTTDRICSIFSKERKPIKQILMIQEGSRMKAILLSAKEGAFFKEHLEKNKPANMWLLLPDGNSYTGVNPPIECKEKVKELLWHANFLNGNANYLVRHRELTQKNMQESPALRQRYLALQVENDKDQKAIFYADPILYSLVAQSI